MKARGERGALLECREVDVCVGSRTLVRGLDLQVRGGSLLAVLGRTAPAKVSRCTPLPACARRHRRTAGGGGDADWTRRALACELALMPQNVEDPFPANVLETVLLGRHPHIARWQWESAQDLAIATDALAAVGLAGYEEREIYTLSGGERRRAALAAVLAQTPRLFLLDEPTNQLDPNHQLEALSLLRERADAGAAVVVTLHDPNLAARFADHALLIGKSGDWRCGDVAETLSAPHLSALYDTRIEVAEIDGRRVFFQA